jgi:hypothetical protein
VEQMNIIDMESHDAELIESFFEKAKDLFSPPTRGESSFS